MANDNTVGGILEAAMEKIKEMSASDTIVGTPVSLGDGRTAVPISKVTIGFAGGGSDFGKPQKDKFGVGTGGGVTVTPIAVLLNEPKGVKLLQIVDSKGSVTDNLIRSAPELIGKIKDLFAKKNDEKDKDD